MITYKIWRELSYNIFTEPEEYLLAIIGSIFSVPLDILLFPLEIVAFIIYKIKEKE